MAPLGQVIASFTLLVGEGFGSSGYSPDTVRFLRYGPARPLRKRQALPVVTCSRPVCSRRAQERVFVGVGQVAAAARSER